MSKANAQAERPDDAGQHTPNAATSTVLQFDIGGMTCAACSARIEKVLNRMPGVVRANVNLPLETATVETDGSLASEAIEEKVAATGYSAAVRETGYAAESRRQEEADARASRVMRRDTGLLVLSALLSAPMVIAMAAMTAGYPVMIPGWVQAILATVVQVLVGVRFYVGAFKAVRAGSANMDVLVALGTSAAWGYSMVLTVLAWPGEPGHLYFEASAVILTLILFGKLLEARAKRSTTAAVRALSALRPRQPTGFPMTARPSRPCLSRPCFPATEFWCVRARRSRRTDASWRGPANSTRHLSPGKAFRSPSSRRTRSLAAPSTAPAH